MKNDAITEQQVDTKTVRYPNIFHLIHWFTKTKI